MINSNYYLLHLIYPDDLNVSVILRLAQFRLVFESKNRPEIISVANTLLTEAALITDPTGKNLLESSNLYC